MSHIRRNPVTCSVLSILLFLLPLTALGQTQLTAPKNKYKVSEDVELGRQAAAQIEQQLPLLRDSRVNAYVERLGHRLVRVVPAEFQHPEFNYYFRVVDARDINAFALPGGPMYVNRGMIEAARTEGEVAGVMAHELSHVVLRHGTAQATKAQKYQWGAIAGAIAGAIIGGPVGEIVGQGSQFGIGAAFLRFSRSYEKQADTLGAQIMARAGYDPRDMASMFETIERQGRRGGPEWLSSHPNPGNRREAITREAQLLRVENPVRDTREFAEIQSRLRGMPAARSMEEIARSQERQGGQFPPGRVGGRVESPSSRFRTYTEGDLFRVSVPENWRQLPSQNAVTYAPEGAYGQVRDQSVFTHGVQAGVTRNETHGLEEATEEFIQSLARGNRNLRRQSGFQRGSLAGREALAVTLSNLSEATGRSETVNVYTTLLSDGNLFYLIAVAPEDEYRSYQSVFQRVTRSLQINDDGIRTRY